MRLRGFLDYLRLKKTTPFGQIATIFTILIMVVFLLTIITLNIGKIAMVKTRVSNAADSAALQMVSALGSLSRMYSRGEPSGKKCEKDWSVFWELVKFVYDMLTLQWWKVASDLINIIKGEVDMSAVVKEFNRAMQKFTVSEQIGESPIIIGLIMMVEEEPNITDIHDYDGDLMTTDKIPYFVEWYAKRMQMLDHVAGAIKEEITGFRERLGDFIVDVGGKRYCDPAKNQCAYNLQVPSPPFCAGVEFNWICGRKGFDGFLEDQLIPLLQRIESGAAPLPGPVDVTFWQPGPDNDEVDDLLKEIDDFYYWARTVLGFYIDYTCLQYCTFCHYPDSIFECNVRSGIAFEYTESLVENAHLWHEGLYTTELESRDPNRCFSNNLIHIVPSGDCLPNCLAKCAPGDTVCQRRCEDDCKPDWYTRMGVWESYANKWYAELKAILDPLWEAYRTECYNEYDECVELCHGNEQCEKACLSQRAQCLHPLNWPQLLRDLRDAMGRLTAFRNEVISMRTAIEENVRDMNETTYYVGAGEDIFHQALYSWAEINPNVPEDSPDRHIWHHVRVTRSNFPEPSWYGRRNWNDIIPDNCTIAINRWGHVCVKVDRYDSEVYHPLWRFRFHKGEPIDDHLNVTDTDGDGILTINDIVRYEKDPQAGAGHYKLVIDDKNKDAYNKINGLLDNDNYRISTTAYGCFGWEMYETEPAPAGSGGIRLVPGSQIQSCYK